MEIWSSFRYAVMKYQCTAGLVRAKQLPCCSVLLCKAGSQHACAIAITPMENCSSFRCAVMQHQSTAETVKAKQLPCCSVLLCKTGSQHARAAAITPMEICYLYRYAVMQHQSTAEMVRPNSFPAVQCSSAKQDHSMLVPLQIHLWRFALHTGVQ